MPILDDLQDQITLLETKVGADPTLQAVIDAIEEAIVYITAYSSVASIPGLLVNSADIVDEE